MNRIKRSSVLPQPKGAFSNDDALQLLLSYTKDPSNVPCPHCGDGTIEVLAFIDPVIGMDGFADVVDPVGEYAAALFCRKCERAIGILPPFAKN